MNYQSSNGLISAEPLSHGHSLPSSLTSLSSLSSTPGARSPVIFSVDVAPSFTNTFPITPPLSSCMPSAISKKLTSLSSSPSTVVEMSKNIREPSAKMFRPTPDLIQAATKDELHEMLKLALDDNLKLEAAAFEARMSAAHHKLHYNLLSIESQEALNRMEVENYMLRREALILRQNPLDPAQTEYKKILKGQCKYLRDENVALRLHLKKAKRMIKIQDLKLDSTQQAIDLLQERIRQNRRHINEMRKPGGPLSHASIIKSRAETPSDCCVSSHHTLNQSTSHHHRKIPEIPSDNFESLNALLLAGSILNQESNKISSPALYCHQKSNSRRHQDQDLQAMRHSSTPSSSQIPNALLPPVQLPAEAENLLQGRLRTLNQSRRRRRKSRDSTISVSDIEDLAQSQAKDDKDSETELYFKQIKNSYSNKDEILPVEEETSNSNSEELPPSQLCTAVKKRKKDDELPWWNIESQGGKCKEKLRVTGV